MGIFMLHDPVFKYVIFNLNLLQDEGPTIIACIVLTLIGAVLMKHLIENPIYYYCFYQTKSKKDNVTGINV